MNFLIPIIIIIGIGWISYRYAKKRTKNQIDEWAQKSQEILKETNPDLSEMIKKHYK